ncbi:MAG: TolC family protein [bacterium]|nr:TolC family protein [bacterium]
MLAGCTSKPVPFSVGTLTNNAKTNYDRISSHQEPLSEPIDLYRAMARALKYNLDYQLAVAQAQLGNAKLNLSHYSLLPNIAANAGYAARNNEQASSSLNMLTNAQNFGASTSQDKAVKSSDLAFSWNILDFGLSYIRSRQAGDKYLINQEMRRKVIHKLLDNVRNAYYRAISYKRLIKRLRHLKVRTQNAYKNMRALSTNSETSPMNALTAERQLLDIKRAIGRLQGDLITAKNELASLMGIKPGMPFKLVPTKSQKLPAKLPFTLEEMMFTALSDRAELRENLYQQRINMREAQAMLLEMLPGLKMYAGPNASSNSFLLNNNWISWGATASWNLLRVFQYPAKRGVWQGQDNVLKTQALALSMTVMAQVQVSRIRYLQLRQKRDTARQYRSVQKRLLQQFRNEAQASRVSEQVLLREELNTLVAEAKYDIANSELQSAYANLFTSIGWDPYVVTNRSLTVDNLAAQLRESWSETGEHITLKTPAKIADNRT